MDTRLAAMKTLTQVIDKNQTLETALYQYKDKMQYFSELSNLVSDALRHLITLDYFISKLCKNKKLSHIVKNALRMGLYELAFTDNPDYAVINSYVNIIKKEEKPASTLVNAVLRSYTREKDKFDYKDLTETQTISIKYSHPEWMVKNWVDEYGVEETEKICVFNLQKPPLTVRANLLKTTKQKLIELFTEHDIEVTDDCVNTDCIKVRFKGNIKEIIGYNDGLWSIQGESSAFVSKVVDPKENDIILDLCSAPGGKACHMAELANNNCKIIAVDVNEKRLKKVTENTDRLGITCVETVCVDGKSFESDILFDKILIDAPCSNTGVLSKRVDAKYKRKPEDIENLSKIQMNLLNNCSKLLKIGGEIVYSTCSIEKIENENVIIQFLEENKEFKLVNIEGLLPFSLEGKDFAQILQSKHNIDGFFIAKLSKVGLPTHQGNP